MFLDLVNQGRKDEERLKSDKVVFRRSAWHPAVLVGYATDAQSVLLGSLIVDGSIYPVPAGSKVLLSRAGWEQANLEARRGLALRFVKEVLLGFDEQLLDSAPADFPKNAGKSTFRAPKVVSTQTGGVQVEGWILEAPHSRGVTFRRSIYWFGNNGQLMRSYLADRLVVQ